MPISSCLGPLTRSVGLFERYMSVTRALYEHYTSVTRGTRPLHERYASVTRVTRALEAEARGPGLRFSTNVTRSSFGTVVSHFQSQNRHNRPRNGIKRSKAGTKFLRARGLEPGRSVGMRPDRYILMPPLAAEAFVVVLAWGAEWVENIGITFYCNIIHIPF